MRPTAREVVELALVLAAGLALVVAVAVARVRAGPGGISDEAVGLGMSVALAYILGGAVASHHFPALAAWYEWSWMVLLSALLWVVPVILLLGLFSL